MKLWTKLLIKTSDNKEIMKKRGQILILKLFPTFSASKISSSSDDRVMVPSDAELRDSDDSSMVEAGDDARDSSSGSPKMFWMLNGCIELELNGCIELEAYGAKLLIINTQLLC